MVQEKIVKEDANQRIVSYYSSSRETIVIDTNTGRTVKQKPRKNKPFSLLLMTEDTDFGLFIAVLSAIPIVLSFLFGFLLISWGSEWGSRNASLLD